jgi:hypothetical protein
MTQPASINREWIAAELVKGMNAERALAVAAQARADSPPDEVLSVLYHEIASADERHALLVEKIAVRYGHTPAPTSNGGIGQALGHLKDKFVGLGSDGLDQLLSDVTSKAQSIHWHAAWLHTFRATGDSESADELAVVLTEEQAHRDALQQGLNRMVEQRARAH